jgi:hypothetical protein
MGAPPTERANRARTTAGWPASRGGAVAGTLPQPAGGHALGVVHEARNAHGRGEVHQQVDVAGVPVELPPLRAEVRAHVPHDLLHAFQVVRGEDLVPVLGHEIQVGTQVEDTMPVRADVRALTHEFEYIFDMQLRYSYRIDPWPRHRIAFGKAFGCARFVVNDAPAFREAAYQGGLPYVTDAELPARLTAAKKAPERAWLNEVSSVVLQQALADLNAAYRNFFASLNGSAKARRRASPGSGQRGGQRREGRRAGGDSLQSAGKTRGPASSAARRSRNPPEVTPGSGVTGGNPRPSGRSGGQSAGKTCGTARRAPRPRRSRSQRRSSAALPCADASPAAARRRATAASSSS